MNVELRYLGRSEVRPRGASTQVRFAPNLARPPAFYDAELAYPVRFREAMSALHAVVVGDLKFKKRDKSAYHAWKARRAEGDAQLQRALTDQARAEALRDAPGGPPPKDLAAQFRTAHGVYWTARRRWAAELAQSDPELFRHLVPCDPVVTVAPDAVFFECFAKDESSYGCLLVERDALRHEAAAGLGTTNVDYSLALYEYFQTLRTYRPTRLTVDPSGFEVRAEGLDEYREEKIDLPPSWLRGFGQISAAIGLPSRRVKLPVDVVYSVLAYLRRHREKTGPRSIVFRLAPGREPVLVLEPWGVELPCRGGTHDGERPEEIKVWGRRRLMALARVLPLCDHVEVALLGSGMPSVWVALLGEMRFVLALSGWTTNDWTSGANLDLLSGGFRVEPRALDALTRYLAEQRLATLPTLLAVAAAPRDVVLGCLNLLAKQGQVVYDFAAEVYRYRPVLPVALSEVLLGPESPELVAGREIWRGRGVALERDEAIAGQRRLLVGRAGGTACEAIVDADGVFTKARCTCTHFFKNRLRAGPCRHLLALRLHAQGPRREQG